MDLITKNIAHKLTDVIKCLYIIFVRPHLEEETQLWSKHYIKNNKALERLQRRATKPVTALCNLTYEEVLMELDMFPFHKRRIMGVSG